MSNKTTVLSGIRVTGRLHLGHYHGVLKNWLTLQSEHDCFFFAADWHALTTHYHDTKMISNHIWEMFIDWLAVGINPELAHLFIQSHVPETAELHLLLSMITPLSWLERVPSYKDQQKNLADKDLNTYGFLGYPLLQTADILLYQASYVPVGEDQVSHIELSREIARRFNHVFGQPVLQEPQALLTKNAKLTGLDGRKMSKSYHNVIYLREKPESVRQKIQTMPTDPARVTRKDVGDPEKCPVWSLHAVYSDVETQCWVQKNCRTAGIGCLECKQPLIQSIQQEVTDIQARAEKYEKDPALVKRIIQQGTEVARDKAKQTLSAVRQAIQLND